MTNSKVIRSFQFGEIIEVENGSYFDKGFVFTMTDRMLNEWKAGRDIPVTDSYCKPIMIPAKNIRAFITQHVEIQNDIARN